MRDGKGRGGEGGRERGEEGKGRREEGEEKGTEGEKGPSPPPRKKILAPPLLVIISTCSKRTWKPRWKRKLRNNIDVIDYVNHDFNFAGNNPIQSNVM